MAHKNYAKCEFVVYATADAASCSTFAAFILIPDRKSECISIIV